MMGLHPIRGIFPIAKRVIKQDTDVWFAETMATVAIPLSFFLAFGLGLKGYISDVDGVPYMVFIAPGLISLTILLEAFRTGSWGLWISRWNTKMIDEFRIKPISTSDIIIGEIIGGFIIALAKGAMVGILLFFLAPFETTAQNIMIYLLYMFPGSILFTCVGAMVGTTFRRPDQIAKSQTIVITPLLYIGGLFFPISVFPEWTQGIIHWLPTTALLDGGRQAFLFGEMSGSYLGSLIVVACLSFLAATALFNWKLSK